MHDMNLRHFRSFYEVARAGSFTAGARTLLVSQSALSVQVRSLEEHLGVTLLDRSKGGVTLSDAGRVAFQYAERVFGEIENMVVKLRESEQRVGGNVSVATVNSIGIYVLPRILSAFREHYPEVRIRIDFHEGEGVIERLVAGRSDFAIVPWSRRYNNLDGIRLAQIKMFLVVAPGHPLAAEGRVSPHELERHAFVGYQDGMHTRSMIDAYFRRLGVSIGYGIESANAATIKHMVMAGMGPGVLPEFAVAGELRRGLLIRIEAPLPLMAQEMMLYYQRTRSFAHTRREFIEYLRSWFDPKSRIRTRARQAEPRGGPEA